MKKFRMILLFLLLVAGGTVCAVAGFYVNENSTAVVDWFHNSVVVTNDDYKELIQETTLTINQLESKVTNLESENTALTNEKTSLTEQVEELEQDLEANQETIDNYLKQIDDINEKLEANTELLKDLKSLIRSLSEKTIKAIIDLPEDLNSCYSRSFYWYGNNALIMGTVTSSGSDRVFYWFNYEEGTLTYLFDRTVFNLPTIVIIDDGFFLYNNSVSFTYRFSTGVLANTDLASNEYYRIEYGNGCYFIGGNILYWNYETFEMELIATGMSSVSLEFNFGLERVFFKKYNSTGCAIYFNLETREAVKFYSYTGFSNFKFESFNFKDSIYALLTYCGDTSGLYKLNSETWSLDLVYSLADVTNTAPIDKLFVSQDFVAFSLSSNMFKFDGENTTLVSSTDKSVYNPVYCETLYEDELQIYFSAAGCSSIYKFDKTTGDISTVYNTSYLISRFHLLNENILLFGVTNTGYIFLLDFSTGEVTPCSTGSYIFDSLNIVLLYDIGDSIYICNYNNGSSICRIKKDTAEVVTFSGNSNYDAYTSYFEIGNKIVFVGLDLGCCIYDNVEGTKITYSSDNSLSNFEEGTIYVKVKDLEDGSVYYKYQYNEDLTEYTRSLVIVE